MKILIKGGRLIDPGQGLDEPRDLLVDKGKVAALLAPGSKVDDAKVLDADGLWVAPGLIDMHVHLREPGQEYKETIATGAAAAVAGGVTAVACMPNTSPVNDNASVTDYILERAANAQLARVYPVGAVSRGQLGEGLAEIGELVDHGCVALSDDGHPVVNAALMRHALEYCKSVGVPILDHCEVLELSAGGSMNEGEISTELGLVGIPAAAEAAMVARDILLCELSGSRLHIQHVSCQASINILAEAKARGVPVTAETCPHYFTLTDQAVRGYDPAFKMNPPLRGEDDRQAVIRALATGVIDVIASDHAPHSPVEKEVEFDQAANGIVGLESLLPLSLALALEGHISPSRFVELLSANPARVLKLPGGTLKVGAPADITMIDPGAAWTLDRDKLLTKGRNTPFHGMRMTGLAAMVIIDGKLVGKGGRVK